MYLPVTFSDDKVDIELEDEEVEDTHEAPGPSDGPCSTTDSQQITKTSGAADIAYFFREKVFKDALLDNEKVQKICNLCS